MLFWEEMDELNISSKSVLLENTNLQHSLQEIQLQIDFKNREIYNLDTRLENLDIFEQHLTSLNLRCEFLNKQISNLENKQKTLLSNNGKTFLDFKDYSNTKIEWRTTETTLENLCTEFKYLTDQLDIANNFVPIDTSVIDDSAFSQISTNVSSSLFSEIDPPSMEDDENLTNKEIINENYFNKSLLINNKPQIINSQKKKMLMKMESFLNFNDHVLPNENLDSSTPDTYNLRGFRINTINENPLYQSKSEQNDITFNKSMKKKLKLIDLPLIEEEYDYEINDIDNNNNNNNKNLLNEFSKYHHKRHSSLPETASIEGHNLLVSSDESIRHFSSYDNGLNSKYNQKNYNITDFIFNTNEEIKFPDSHHLQNKNSHPFISSSPFSTFKDSYIDDEGSNFNSYNNNNNNNNENENIDDNLSIHSNISYLENSDSDESYGDENAIPLIMKKESILSLHKCKSHESIFSTISKSTVHFPLRERNLDLKAQTMKWLKPNFPTVSSSVQPYAAEINLNSIGSNAHNDIINILHSGVNNNTHSISYSSPIKIPTKIPESNHQIESENQQQSWISQKLFSSPMPIGRNNSFNSFNDSDGNLSSWFSNLIPNSAYTQPEIGKLIGQPSAKNIKHSNNYNYNNNNKDNIPSLTKYPKKNIKTSNLFRKQLSGNTINVNGPSSSLNIERNGNRIIRHGYGSEFNNKVISTRVSHGALREALEFDMVL